MAQVRGRVRRGWVWLVALVAVGLLAPITAQNAGAQSDTRLSFVTRPDLRPPAVTVHTPAQPGTAPGQVFLAPKGGGPSGVLIADTAGQPVWFQPTFTPAIDFKVQQYLGRPVLAWWQGAFSPATGSGGGGYLLLNENYLPVGLVRAGFGLEGADLHELEITPQNTALIAVYRRVAPGVPVPNVPSPTPILEAVVQEVDITTGAVLFEWRSLQHVALEESFQPPPPPGAPYDYFHINSIDVDTDGNLLVSGRHTHAVYKIDRRSGEVIWRLGGKRSDFGIGEGAEFSSQHDARRNADGTLSIFDNAAGSGEQTNELSRGLVLDVDEVGRTASLARSVEHPTGLLSVSQGNHMVLPDGGSFVGWGDREFFTEYGPGGDVRFDASFTDPATDSYRAVRADWTGRPLTPPVSAPRFAPDGGMTVFASWNGATEVTGWRVLTGPSPSGLSPVVDVPRTGFETAIPVPVRAPLVAVQALAADGSVLGTSVPLPPTP